MFMSFPDETQDAITAAEYNEMAARRAGDKPAAARLREKAERLRKLIRRK